ncbi:MAG: rod shape-determining protein [Eubacteriales bacterium]
MAKNNFFTTDIGIDLGTSTVLVYVKEKGVVLCEPSVVAIDKTTDKIVRIGREAEQMLGRAPENISIVRPLKDGVISQYNVTLKMLQYFIHRACGTTLVRPRVMICVPSGINEAEEMTVINATNQAGARQTLLIDEPIAAALGAGIDINAPKGYLVVDIGGGTTDIAVISYGGAVVSQSIKIAGNDFDEALRAYMKDRYKVLIGERTAEMIKIKVGAVHGNNSDKPTQMSVKGRCLVKGLPKVVTFNANETLGALSVQLDMIIDAISLVIQKTPVELLGDIYKNGIVLTGGGSKLTGLDRLIEDTIGIRTYLAKDPVACVVNGTGKALEELESGALGFLGSFGN